MPRYFFDVRDGVDIPDHIGTELPNLHAVRREAVQAAGEAIKELGDKFWESRDWRLVVLDEQGDHVLTLNFSGQGEQPSDLVATEET